MQIILYISSPGPFDMQAQDATAGCWIFRDTHWRQGRFLMILCHAFSWKCLWLKPQKGVPKTQRKWTQQLVSQIFATMSFWGQKLSAAERDPD